MNIEPSSLIIHNPSQDEIARIRKRKRGRNMLNRSETRRITCVSVTGFVTFSRVSVAAYTTEPDHFYVNITETWSCMFPPRFRSRILAISSCACGIRCFQTKFAFYLAKTLI